MFKERENRSQMITLQFGRASNHVGAQYWNILEKSDDKKAVEPQYRSIDRPRVFICDFNRALGPAMSRQGNSELGSDEMSRVYNEQASRVQVYRRDDVDGGGDMYWTNYMSTPLENCYTHFTPGDYGTKEDAYYYSPHTDWSETSLRRLLEGCDRLGTVQMLYDVSASFTGLCTTAFEWLAEEAPKKDVILLPIETFGKGTEASHWCLNFAYSISRCLPTESSPLHVLGCLPSSQPFGSILDDERLYRRSAPVALSLAALAYSQYTKNEESSYKTALRGRGGLADWGLLGGGDGQWRYTADAVTLPDHFPRQYLGLDDDAHVMSVETSLQLMGPACLRQVTRCLSELRKLKTTGGLDQCIVNSNGALEADNVDEFASTLRGMMDVDAPSKKKSADAQGGALLEPIHETYVLDHVADLLRKQHLNMTAPSFRTRIEPEVVFSANLFFRRFFTRHSVLEFDPLVVIFCCVSLACKTEEFHDTDVRGLMLMPEGADSSGSKYVVDPKILAEVELDLLSGLNYDLVVDQPWPPLLLLCRRLVSGNHLDRPTAERIFRHASDLLTSKWPYCDAVAAFPPGTLAACAVGSVWPTIVSESTTRDGLEVVSKIIADMGAEEGSSADELEKTLNEITILFTDFERNRSDPMMFDPTLMMQLVKYRQKFERTRLRTLAGDESRASSRKGSKRKSSKSKEGGSKKPKKSKKEAAPPPAPSVLSSPDASSVCPSISAFSPMFSLGRILLNTRDLAAPKKKTTWRTVHRRRVLTFRYDHRWRYRIRHQHYERRQLVASDFFPAEAKPRFRYAGFWPGIFNHAGTPEVERMQKVE
ncbi:hypothetical protein FOL46_007155 [Perkinsus olseni]|uniref:Cyclin N-terminal domain-containing protein n=1 Tax=Perkinsus olseni TaxID=32597 RepID=A0A7J6LFD1_PEROL|nr:hypothetical protein FOL46_007155 [Perkinsus olseni]